MKTTLEPEVESILAESPWVNKSKKITQESRNLEIQKSGNPEIQQDAFKEKIQEEIKSEKIRKLKRITPDIEESVWLDFKSTQLKYLKKTGQKISLNDFCNQAFKKYLVEIKEII